MATLLLAWGVVLHAPNAARMGLGAFSRPTFGSSETQGRSTAGKRARGDVTGGKISAGVRSAPNL
ncbi:MAG: hypothetical protein MI919_33010 [Holophagales bacterium]|nr:hypothetical protein [Holophagales bacterium]